MISSRAPRPKPIASPERSSPSPFSAWPPITRPSAPSLPSRFRLMTSRAASSVVRDETFAPSSKSPASISLSTTRPRPSHSRVSTRFAARPHASRSRTSSPMDAFILRVSRRCSRRRRVTSTNRFKRPANRRPSTWAFMTCIPTSSKRSAASSTAPRMVRTSCSILSKSRRFPAPSQASSALTPLLPSVRVCCMTLAKPLITR